MNVRPGDRHWIIENHEGVGVCRACYLKNHCARCDEPCAPNDQGVCTDCARRFTCHDCGVYQAENYLHDDKWCETCVRKRMCVSCGPYKKTDCNWSTVMA